MTLRLVRSPTDVDDPDAPKDRFVDQWRAAKGVPMQRVLDEVAATIASAERERQKARSAVANERWDQLVEALACDLAHAVLLPPPSGKVVLPRKNGDHLGPARYRNAAFGKPRKECAAALHRAGLVIEMLGEKAGSATTLEPTPAFRSLVALHGVTLADIGRNLDEEVLILTRSRKLRRGRSKARIDYAETTQTQAIRASVRAVNEYLDAADITFDDDELGAVDTTDRMMRRFFTVLEDEPVRFDQGGRLFGGFWQPMKSHRRKHIRINGEPVATIDYSAAFTHIAFAEQGVRPEPGVDLYAIPDLVGVLDRPLTKKAFNVLYFVGAGMTKWPEDLTEAVDAETGEVTVGFPPGVTPTRVRRAILKSHPSLSEVFGSYAGYRLMWKESEIMLLVLRLLREEGLVALPIHDGLAVPLSGVPLAMMTMDKVSTLIAGHAIPTSVDLFERPPPRTALYVPL